MERSCTCILIAISFRLFATGMPDDCTILALHIVGRSPDDIMDKDHQ